MKNKKRIILILVIILLLAVVLVCCKYMSFEKEQGTVKQDDYQDYIPEPEISAEDVKTTFVDIYYLNKETKKLESESRVIEAETLVENPYLELIKLLLKDPQNQNLEKLIPTNTEIYDANISGGCVILNFSNQILNFSDDETKLNMINSIVNTLQNLTEVRSVKILVEGNDSDQFNEEYI